MKRKGGSGTAAGAGETVRRRAKRIRMILMDVDGVLTDGRIVLLGDGAETKSFDVKDGVAIHLARRAGLRTGIITGRTSEAVRLRARELGIDEVHEGALEKLPVYRGIRERNGLADEEVCYVGDDWVDIPILRRVGLAVAPADADGEAVRHAHLITRHAGGRGAVREVVELILRAQGKRQPLLDRYLEEEAAGPHARKAGGSR